MSYKIVEAGAGGEIKGDTVLATRTIRQSGGLQVDDTDVINELLDDAADQLATTIVQSASSLPTAVAKDKMVSFNIACSMTDPRQQPILISGRQRFRRRQIDCDESAGGGAAAGRDGGIGRHGDRFRTRRVSGVSRASTNCVCRAKVLMPGNAP